jgi:tetratricopeptide (TPR) repeat protein
MAESLYQSGHLEEADQASLLAESLGSSFDLATQILWRSVRAKVRVQQGAVQEARDLAEQSIEIAKGTDFLVLQALAFEALAEVERLSGRQDEAIAALREELDRYERKEDRPDAERTRALIDTLMLESEASRATEAGAARHLPD